MYISMCILLHLIKFVFGWLLFTGILLHAAICELLKSNVSEAYNVELDTKDSQYNPLRKQHGATHT